MISVKNLKIADVRYFDKEHNGLEFTLPLSKVILLDRGDTYINLLNPGEIAPIYKRINNKFNMLGDEYFGTKIEHVCGEEVTGEAWLLTDWDPTRVFASEEVTLEQVENYVLDSEDYFHNRDELIEGRIRRRKLLPREVMLLIDMQVKDREKSAAMNLFFSARGCQKIYKK